jgi:hypothetical protein
VRIRAHPYLVAAALGTAGCASTQPCRWAPPVASFGPGEFCRCDGLERRAQGDERWPTSGRFAGAYVATVCEGRVAEYRSVLEQGVPIVPKAPALGPVQLTLPDLGSRPESPARP